MGLYFFDSFFMFILALFVKNIRRAQDWRNLEMFDGFTKTWNLISNDDFFFGSARGSRQGEVSPGFGIKCCANGFRSRTVHGFSCSAIHANFFCDFFEEKVEVTPPASTQASTDEEVNVLVWKCLGYRYRNGQWDGGGAIRVATTEYWSIFLFDGFKSWQVLFSWARTN